MYVALGTTSEGFRGRAGEVWLGCCASCRPVLEETEYVERDDWARLWDMALADREP